MDNYTVDTKKRREEYDKAKQQTINERAKAQKERFGDVKPGATEVAGVTGATVLSTGVEYENDPGLRAALLRENPPADQQPALDPHAGKDVESYGALAGPSTVIPAQGGPGEVLRTHEHTPQPGREFAREFGHARTEREEALRSPSRDMPLPKEERESQAEASKGKGSPQEPSATATRSKK